MSQTPSSEAALPKDLCRRFISACHILHYHQYISPTRSFAELLTYQDSSVLDAYGHLSVRHPTKPGVFIMARQIAPALVSSQADLIQYQVADASPVDPSLTDGYVERYIHSEIFKRYPEVHAVIHSHAESIISYGISGQFSV